MKSLKDIQAEIEKADLERKLSADISEAELLAKKILQLREAQKILLASVTWSTLINEREKIKEVLKKSKERLEILNLILE